MDSKSNYQHFAGGTIDPLHDYLLDPLVYPEYNHSDKVNTEKSSADIIRLTKELEPLFRVQELYKIVDSIGIKINDLQQSLSTRVSKVAKKLYRENRPALIDDKVVERIETDEKVVLLKKVIEKYERYRDVVEAKIEKALDEFISKEEE